MSSFPRYWPAPAKLNLFLHVVDRYGSGEHAGYHQIQTVFQFVDLMDEIAFSIRNDGVVRRLGEDELPEQDLCVRAALALRETILQQNPGCGQLGVDIELQKRIPVGAGLGGGSSDAATTLMALNELWQLGLERQTLAKIGLKLGADVPVFIHGHAAWAEGIGHRLTPVNPPTPQYIVIVPPVFVKTDEIYHDCELTRHTPMMTIRDFPMRGDSGEIWAVTHNDLQAVTCRRYPIVGDALMWLQQFGPARMSGSGGAVFAELAGSAAADRIMQEKPVKYQGFIVRGLNNHPLAN